MHHTDEVGLSVGELVQQGVEVDVCVVDVHSNIVLPCVVPVAREVGGEVTHGLRVVQLEASHHCNNIID